MRNKNQHVNIVGGNATVGMQVGNSIRDNGDGTYLVNGVSVGSPEVQPCGCPGASTVTIAATEAEDTCVRCGKYPYAS